MSRSRSITALLLSALVFPGAGQMFLKRRGRALLFIVPTIVAAFYIVRTVLAPATEMANQLVSAGVMPDPLAIAAQLEKAGTTSGMVALAVYVMLGCWIAAALDAWLLGRQPRR
jgi:predicted neutral ceramidase superfamily lipid hydrolase